MNKEPAPNVLSDLAVFEIEALVHQPAVQLELNPMIAFLLIAQLQLALRHPQNDGLPSKEMRALIQKLRRQIAAPGDSIDTLIAMGFDARFDVDKDARFDVESEGSGDRHE